MKPDEVFLTFPPGALGEAPVRIPVLWNDGCLLALNKPPGVPAFQDSRLGGGARSLLATINDRAKAGQPQFQRLDIRSLAAVNLLDRDLSGIVLYAKSPEAKGNFKNAMGSLHFSFRYRFLAQADEGAEERFCELPLAVHNRESRTLISHQTGKKTFTRFRCLQDLGRWRLWESESPYDRFHQVRLHAFEAGLRILNETVYPAGAASAIDTGTRRYDGLALHLFAIRLPLGDHSIELEAPYPAPLATLLKRLSARQRRS